MGQGLNKILLGCGCGCAVIVVVVIALAVGGTMIVRDSFKGFDGAIENREALDQRFGQAADFEPWPTDTIPAERLEAFLAVREATMPERNAIEAVFESFGATESDLDEAQDKPLGRKLGTVLKVTRSAMGLGPKLGRFFDARNRAMLDAGIGMGEYSYLYTLVFHAWLRHDANGGSMDSRVRVNVEREPGVEQSYGSDSDRTIMRIRSELRSMLGHQLQAVEREGGDPAWREALSREIEALRADPRRVPWQDEIPAGMRAALEPFRERLGATYRREVNQFELAQVRKSGGFSIEAD